MCVCVCMYVFMYVYPTITECTAAVCFRLGNFIFMMWKNKIDTTRMYVNGWSEEPKDDPNIQRYIEKILK